MGILKIEIRKRLLVSQNHNNVYCPIVVGNMTQTRMTTFISSEAQIIVDGNTYK